MVLVLEVLLLLTSHNWTTTTTPKTARLVLGGKQTAMAATCCCNILHIIELRYPISHDTLLGGLRTPLGSFDLQTYLCDAPPPADISRKMLAGHPMRKVRKRHLAILSRDKYRRDMKSFVCHGGQLQIVILGCRLAKSN